MQHAIYVLLLNFILTFNFIMPFPESESESVRWSFALPVFRKSDYAGMENKVM